MIAPRERARPVLAAIAVACVAALLWNGAIAAQTIAGTVRSSGDPIVGATVRVLELDRAVHSGARGQFAFSNVPRGWYTVLVEVAVLGSYDGKVYVAVGEDPEHGQSGQAQRQLPDRFGHRIPRRSHGARP